MDELRPTTKAYLASLLLLAAGLTAVAARGQLAFDARIGIIAAALAACMAAAWLFPIEFAARTKLYVDTAVAIAAVFLLPPAIAVIAVGAGTLAAHGIRQEMRDWAQALFNMAQVMLGALAAALLLTLAGWHPGNTTYHIPRLLPALALVAVVTYLLNVSLIATVTALESRTSILATIGESLRVDPVPESLAHATLVTFGALAALVVATEPWFTVLLAVPIVSMHVTLNRQARLRRDAERARMMSDTGLAEAQRLANLGSWEWYPAANRWVWSDEAYRLLGLEPGEVAPSDAHIVSMVHPDDRERVQATLQRAQRTGAPFEIEHQLRLRDGTERHVYQRCEARSDNGRGLALFGTIQDVTERVETERAMEAATRAAQEADRAKTQLLTMASHDLRTPLTAIKGYIELVHSGAAGELNGEQRELLDVAYRNANELAALISDLLDLARLEAGGLHLRKEPTDIVQSVNNVLRTLAPEAAAKNVALRAATSGTLPPADADPSRLNQILLNLVGNAVKFTDQGHVTVSVSTEGHWVRIVVTDTGPGIPADQLPYIFEEFNQGGESARRKGGAGLGLAIVKQLVELHEGTIAVESKEGAGTTFTVRLPVNPRYTDPHASDAAMVDERIPNTSLSPAHFV